MRAASLPKRQRIYGVGPASNIVLALICAGIFSAMSGINHDAPDFQAQCAR